ncbi:MAG TPA: PilZ domain-containing protein [Steroidobacteraceae bacterium]|nr:PilZ domain-containing protein [Steroidobacteraceae bacterium]
MEHRWGVRHPLDVSVRLDGRPHLPTFARLKNASSSGAYLETRTAPPMLSQVWVELGWDRRDDSKRIAAYVVRTDQDGIGLEWCDFAPRAIVALIERSRRLVASDHRDDISPAIRRLPSAAARSPAGEALPVPYAPLKNPPAIARVG